MLTLVSGDSEALRVIKVCTRRTRQTAEAHCLQFWNVPLRWECGSYTLRYEVNAASLPVILPHDEPPSLHAIYRKAVELIELRQRAASSQPDTTEQVVEAIEQGMTEQRRVALRLGLSVATLRRRLHKEGTSFRELRRQTLNASAKSLLEQRHHIAEIADVLGFSDFRSFNRAFKTWNGVTPGQYASRYQREQR